MASDCRLHHVVMDYLMTRRLMASRTPRHCLLFHHSEICQDYTISLVSQQCHLVDTDSIDDILEAPPLHVDYRVQGVDSLAFRTSLRTLPRSSLDEEDALGETLLFKAVRQSDLQLREYLRSMLVGESGSVWDVQYDNSSSTVLLQCSKTGMGIHVLLWRVLLAIYLSCAVCWIMGQIRWWATTGIPIRTLSIRQFAAIGMLFSNTYSLIRPRQSTVIPRPGTERIW